MTPAAMKDTGRPVHSVNPSMRWTARLVPVFLAMVVAYELYLVGEHILMAQFYRQYNRFSLAVGLLVPYVVLAALMVTSYLRILYTIHHFPGAITLGPESARYFYGNNRDRSRDGPMQQKLRLSKPSLAGGHGGDLESGLASSVPYGADSMAQPQPDPRMDPDSPGLELFYTRDMFECAADGRPIWCNECGTWKPDRAHHCSEINRCVRKMDHFCPWVGGIVAETTFKFFIQFNFYAMLICAFTVAICGYALSCRSARHASADARIIVGLALAGFFGLFAYGMFVTCAYYALKNLTTVESRQLRDRARTMAVRILRFSPPVEGRYGTITYPLPKVEAPPGYTPTGEMVERGRHPGPHGHAEPSPEGQGRAEAEAEAADPFEVARAARAARRVARDQLACRTFAIVPVEKGMNVWDLGWRKNWASVMGTHVLDWLLPIRHSPCSYHEMHRSLYPVSPEFKRLLASHKLPPCTEMEEMLW